MSQAAWVRLENLSMTYQEGSLQRPILSGAQASFAKGHFSALLGPSGSGKSTLLNLIAGLDRPQTGKIWIGDQELTALSEREQTRFRRRHLGIIFQFFNLFPSLNVLENVLLPLQLNGQKNQARNRRLAQEWLTKVGLGQRLETYPDKLSGGEQQRIALVRAMLHQPQLILADEPTGNLDENTAAQVAELLLQMVREQGQTLIMVTHNAELAARADQIYDLHEGKLLSRD